MHRSTHHAPGGETDTFDWYGLPTLEIIARSIAVKADVVNADPLERGRRQVLNAGHTIAHAIERESNYALLHGEAVAIGLVLEAELGEAAGITAAGTAHALRSALGGAGLPTSVPPGLDHDRLIDVMRIDKKSRAGSLSFALLSAIGTPAGDDSRGWSTSLGETLVREVLATPPRAS